MLEKLTIRNFQNHKKLEIDFDEHITCVVGRSDVGKSAIIRALKWVCTNRPSGSGFIRHGSKACNVRLRVDGKKVNRHRSRQDNTYILDGKSYSALGQGGIPEEIVSLLNISPSLNFQNQMDSPFWFMLTPGEVSRQINQIINLELIDKTLANIGSQLRKAKSTVQVCEERLEETKQRVKDLAWAKQADKELQELEALDKRLQEKTCRLDVAREIVSSVRTLTQDRDRLSGVKESGIEVMELADKLHKRQERLEELRELVGNIEKQGDSLVESMKELKVLHAQLEKEMDGKCPLCKQSIKGERIWNVL